MLSTGKVECWGDNAFGELGNGTTTTFLLPVAVKQITTATKLFAGSYGFCALLSTGHLSCWGDNQNGELGNGTTTSSDVPVPVSGLDNVMEVTAGNFDNCALLSTGRVECWGYNGFGQLGNGTTTSSDVPVAVTGITAAASLSTDGDGDSYCAAISTGQGELLGLQRLRSARQRYHHDLRCPRCGAWCHYGHRRHRRQHRGQLLRPTFQWKRLCAGATTHMENSATGPRRRTHCRLR